MRGSQVCEKATFFVKQSGEMIGEKYKITGVVQADTIRHKRDLVTFIERSLRLKKAFNFNAFCEDRVDVSRPSNVGGEMSTEKSPSRVRKRGMLLNALLKSTKATLYNFKPPMQRLRNNMR